MHLMFKSDESHPFPSTSLPIIYVYTFTLWGYADVTECSKPRNLRAEHEYMGN
jgi:hypothetical protein